MQSKYVVSGVVAVVFIAAIAFFATRHTQAPTAEVTNSQQQNGSQQSAAPVNTNVGSVAGVDLSEFGTQANQSASLSAQDGSSDAQAISSDGQTINSSTDSVNAPNQ